MGCEGGDGALIDDREGLATVETAGGGRQGWWWT